MNYFLNMFLIFLKENRITSEEMSLNYSVIHSIFLGNSFLVTVHLEQQLIYIKPKMIKKDNFNKNKNKKKTKQKNKKRSIKNHLILKLYLFCFCSFSKATNQFQSTENIFIFSL